MDYKELVERLEEWNENLISELCADDILNCDDLCGCTGDCIVVQAATAITDLLARAEARCKALETRLETAEKMVKEYQDIIVPGYRERAEKAERCIEEVNTAILLKSKTDALNAIKRWRGIKEE